MATTKSYLDLNGLKYVLEKLSHADSGTGVVTGVSQSKGIISVSKKTLGTSDISGIDALGYGTGVSIGMSQGTDNKTAKFTPEIALGNGQTIQSTPFYIISGGAITSTLNTKARSLTLSYSPVGSGYVTTDTNSNILLDSTKLTGKGETGADTNIALVGYVNDKVQEAIKGGVVYKGATGALPTSAENGDMYKASADFTFGATGSQTTVKEGDTIIYKATGDTGSWDVIPSGNDIEYTGVKVGNTTVINASVGGDVTFAAGKGAAVSGDASTKTVTYSHASVTGATGITTASFVKIKTDEFGHVNGTTAVDKADITTLLETYVSSLGVGEDKLLSVSAASGDVVLSSTTKLSNAVTKIEGLSVSATDGVSLKVGDTTTTYKYTHPTTTAKAAAFVKVGKDSLGHVVLGGDIVQEDLTDLLGDYYLTKQSNVVSSIGGKSGVITLKNGAKDNGSINLTISDAGQLSAAIVGLGSAAYTNSTAYATAEHTHTTADITDFATEMAKKQDKLGNSTATITTFSANAADYTAYKGATANETIVFNSVSLSSDGLAKGTTENTLQNITYAEIDALFTA